MAGRNRGGRFNGPRGYPPAPIRDGPFIPGPYPHPARLEEELELQHEEIQRLVAENRRLAATHVDLRRELGGAQDEIHRLNQIVANVQMDKERHTRDLVDKCMKLEADLRSTEPMRAEVVQLHSDVQKFNAQRHDLLAQVHALTQDMARAQADLQQLPALKSEVETLHQELVRARTSLDYEKKATNEQYEQRQAMEKNLISMAREVEKLRAELANYEKRPWGPGNPTGQYGTKLGGYSGAYADAYGLHSASAVEKSSPYGSASDHWGPYEKQRGHVLR